MFVPTLVSAIKSGVLTLAAAASLTSLETPPQSLSQSEISSNFWYTYLTQEKEQQEYIQALVTSLPTDVLFEILSKYIVLIADATKRSICDNAAMRFVPKDLTVDSHYIFHCEHLKLTSDKKYYITVQAKGSCHPGDESVLMWDSSQSKVLERTGNNYKAPFVYLKRKNQLLCTKEVAKKHSCILYDIATQQEATVKEDIPRLSWDEDRSPIIVNSLENYCVIKCGWNISIVNLDTLKKQENIVHSYDTFSFNNEGNLFAATIDGYQQAHLQLFALKDGMWEQVIFDFPLPFDPGFIHFMKNDYLLLYQNGRHGMDGFLHLQIQHENNKYGVKTIDDSQGVGCIVREANNNFFACWQGEKDKNFQLVSYDGSLVIHKDNFQEFRSDFSHDERYYVASDCGEYDHHQHTYTRKPELLLLSLYPEEKNACVIEETNDSISSCTHVAFHKNKPFFIAYSDENCSLYNLVGKKLHSWHIPKGNHNFKFAPDECAVIMTSIGEQHTFLSDEHMLLLENLEKHVSQNIPLQEYFLLKNIGNKHNDFSEFLYNNSSQPCKSLYNTITRRLEAKK
jgi:hypothetical protein